VVELLLLLSQKALEPVSAGNLIFPVVSRDSRNQALIRHAARGA